MLYAFGFAIGREIMREIFSSSISAKSLDMATRLIFNKSNEFFEAIKYIGFMFDREDPSEPSKVINKGDEVGGATNRGNTHRTYYIRMYQGKLTFGTNSSILE